MFVLMELLHRMSLSSCIGPISNHGLRHAIRFQNILQFYNDDLPSPLSFESELDLWLQKWTSEPQLASELDTPEKALPHTGGDVFPNIRVLFRIMATLPVTSCECE